MKKKIIAGVLAASCIFSLLPVHADIILKDNVVNYDFYDFDESSAATAGYKIATGVENRATLSHHTEDGVTFLRMSNTTKVSNSDGNTVPYLYIPVNGGEGVTYTPGKKIAIEVKFRTDTQVIDWEPDARLQLKYNLPDNVEDLKKLSNTDSDGYTRDYRHGFNDCNLWGAENAGFRAPNWHVTDSRQTSMSATNIPYVAGVWHIIKTYIDPQKGTTDYEVTNCQNGQTYRAKGYRPYFSLGTKLESLAFANFFMPIDKMDFDYVRIYEYSEKEVSAYSWECDFEEASTKAFTITDQNKFQFISGTGKSGAFAALTQNGVYTLPMATEAGEKYFISVSWKEKTPASGTTLSLLANGSTIDSQNVKDGDWNTTTAIFTASSANTTITTNISSGGQYYIDDYFIEKLIPNGIDIKVPEKVLKGETVEVTPVIITKSGKALPFTEKFDYTLTLAGSAKSTITGTTLNVSEDEALKKFTITLKSLNLDMESTKYVEVIDEIDSEITYEDNDGKPLYNGISTNGVKSNIKVTNRAGDDRNVTIAAAVYEGDDLKSVLGVETLELASSETAERSFGPYESFKETEQLKVFVWKDMVPQALTETNEYTDILQEIYVATYGDDDAAGTIDDPLATLEAARNLIRRQGVPKGGVTVYIRGGTYYREQAFTLTASDSGTAENPVTYKAYPGEKPIFTQGVDISLSDANKVEDSAILSRLPDNNARNHLYYINLEDFGFDALTPANYPGAYTSNVNSWIDKLRGNDLGIPEPTIEKVPTSATNEVFFDGKPMTVARYPNGDSWIYMNEGELVDCGAIPRFWEENMVGSANYIPVEDRDINDCFTFKFTHGTDKERVNRWTNAKDALMFGFWYHNWATQTVGIGSIDTEANTITSDIPSYFGVRDQVSQDNFAKYYVYNLLEEIDTDGEYYFDRENLILYFYRSDDMTDNKKITVGKGNKTFVSINSASYINIEGLEITAGRSTGISVNTCNNVTIKNCTVHNLASNAISCGGNNNLVDGCTVENVNGGISISSSGSYKNGFERGNSKVQNCTITNFARMTRVYTTGISLSGVGNSAVNNKISDSYHMAMGMSGNDNLIQGNEIFDVCKFANDAAAIYNGRSWLSRGHQIIGNYFHDIHPDPIWAKTIGVNAIFADDTQSNVTIKGNIFEDIDGNAVKFNGGVDHVVENNVFIRCARRGILPGGALTIGNGAYGQSTSDDYLLAINFVDHLNGLVSGGYLNSCWKDDSHAIDEVKTFIWNNGNTSPEVEVSAIENFALFMKSDEWRQNEQANIEKYINAEWHKKFPEIYLHIRDHAGDSWGNVFRNNILIDTEDPKKPDGYGSERLLEESNYTTTGTSLLNSGEYRSINFGNLSQRYQRIQTTSENTGIGGAKVKTNPQGMIVNDDCTTADGFTLYDENYGAVTCGTENGVSFVRLTNTKAQTDRYHAAMLYNMREENIQFESDEVITIDTRIRFKVTDTSDSSDTGPYATIKLNHPEDPQRVYSYYMDTLDSSGNPLQKTLTIGGYYGSLVAFEEGEYAYAGGYYTSGSTVGQTKMNWKKPTNADLEPRNKFSEWVRVVIKIDKIAGTATYILYNEDGQFLSSSQETFTASGKTTNLSNMTVTDYLDNITFTQVNPGRGDIIFDVDYVKISVNKK